MLFDQVPDAILPAGNQPPTKLQDLLVALTMALERVNHARWHYDMQQAEQRDIERKIIRSLADGEEVVYGHLKLRREGKKLVLDLGKAV